MQGDVVLIMYEGKSKPGSYRLGVVTEVEVDSDGCVRNVTVQYSLLSELPYEDRMQYRGITKKKIRACVQRLILILPVEERCPCPVTDQRDDGDNFSPGGQADTVVEEAAVGEDEAGVREAEDCGDRTMEVQAVHEGGTKELRKSDEYVKERFSKSFKSDLKSCAILGSMFMCEDFEGVVYEEFANKIDWSQIDEEERKVEK